MAETQKGGAKELTAGDVAKIVGGTVRVPKRDEDGTIVRVDSKGERVQEGGVIETVKRPVRGDDIVSFRDYGGHVVAVTVDGQRLSARK